jgi:hypothetical protein
MENMPHGFLVSIPEHATKSDLGKMESGMFKNEKKNIFS